MDKIWMDMFWLGVPVTEKILRSVIVYLFLIGGLRLAGKRELAQLNPFDLIVLLTLSNTVQNAIIGDDNSVVGGLIGAGTLLMINYFVVRFLFRHPTIERLAEGKATHLIHKGKIQDDQLAREMISQAELEAAARRQGIAHLREVEEAVLEPSGIVTFSAREPAPEMLRHRELLEQLNKLSRDVAALRAASPSPPAA
jgi:uncharacterized membrane protein YcaP (DUF421 family)